MNEDIENQIKSEICKFNESLFGLVKSIDDDLELDERTFTIIENSNKFLIFCAVKDLHEKKTGDPVCVIYNEDAERNPQTQPILFGRSLAQYKNIYKKSSGKCQTITKKLSDDFLPDDMLWSYSFRNYVIYQNHDGSYGLIHEAQQA